MIFKRILSYIGLVLLPLILVSCASAAGPEKSLLGIANHAGPEQALKDYLQVYEAMKDKGADTSNVRVEIERLADKYPGSEKVLQKNAEIAFEHRDLRKSANFLDRLYQLDPSLSDASILRSRIALAEGNKTLSKEVINRQLKLTPDNAELYEVLAATLYFEQKYTEAEEALKVASKLGGPHERISYHLGLIAEAQGEQKNAIKHYEKALKGDAPFEVARHRLTALKALQK